MKVKVRYNVQYETEIEVEGEYSEDEISDLLSDIEIPENETSKYVENTFECLPIKLTGIEK